jgi:hypothetical protein
MGMINCESYGNHHSFWGLDLWEKHVKLEKGGLKMARQFCVNEVEKSLENYPYKVVACELIKGLKFGFPLNYSGPRSPITSKNLKSVADMPKYPE